MTYIIVFDFPDEGQPIYAADYKGSPGFTLHTDTGRVLEFETEDAAGLFLTNAYPPAINEYGSVAELVQT